MCICHSYSTVYNVDSTYTSSSQMQCLMFTIKSECLILIDKVGVAWELRISWKLNFLL